MMVIVPFIDYHMLNEIELAAGNLKNDKAPGKDNLPAELFKNGGETINAY